MSADTESASSPLVSTLLVDGFPEDIDWGPIDATFPKNEIDVVIYHKNCRDGFGCRFAVEHYYRTAALSLSPQSASSSSASPSSSSPSSSLSPPPVVLREIVYCAAPAGWEPSLSEILPQITDKNVLLCDLTLPLLTMRAIQSKARHFLCIDHHDSGTLVLKAMSPEHKVYHKRRSAAYLTWRFLFRDDPNVVPQLIHYIQDADIWTSDYKLSRGACRAFIAGLDAAFPTMQYSDYVGFLSSDGLAIRSTIEAGQKQLVLRRRQVTELVDRATIQFVQLPNGVCAIVAVVCNVPTFCISDVGHDCLTKFPLVDFSCIINHNNSSANNAVGGGSGGAAAAAVGGGSSSSSSSSSPVEGMQTSFSLRSQEDRMDVSKVAKLYNGGGHDNASGCNLSSQWYGLPSLALVPSHNRRKLASHPEEEKEEEENSGNVGRSVDPSWVATKDSGALFYHLLEHLYLAVTPLSRVSHSPNSVADSKSVKAAATAAKKKDSQQVQEEEKKEGRQELLGVYVNIGCLDGTIAEYLCRYLLQPHSHHLPLASPVPHHFTQKALWICHQIETSTKTCQTLESKCRPSEDGSGTGTLQVTPAAVTSTAAVAPEVITPATQLGTHVHFACHWYFDGKRSHYVVYPETREVAVALMDDYFSRKPLLFTDVSLVESAHGPVITFSVLGCVSKL